MAPVASALPTTTEGEPFAPLCDVCDRPATRRVPAWRLNRDATEDPPATEYRCDDHHGTWRQ